MGLPAKQALHAAFFVEGIDQLVTEQIEQVRFITIGTSPRLTRMPTGSRSKINSACIASAESAGAAAISGSSAGAASLSGSREGWLVTASLSGGSRSLSRVSVSCPPGGPSSGAPCANSARNSSSWAAGVSQLPSSGSPDGDSGVSSPT